MPKGQKVCEAKNGKRICNTPAGPNAKKCKKCNAEFPVTSSTQRCPRCSASLNKNSRTCSYCAYFPLRGDSGKPPKEGIRKKRLNHASTPKKKKPKAKAKAKATKKK